MQCYAIVSGGVVEQVFCCDESMLPTVPEGKSFYPVPRLCDADDLYWHDGAIHFKPPRPDAHIWDAVSLSWVPDAALMWQRVREQRKSLLNATDWTQLPDVPLATKEAWATYRQALRDITEQPDPFNIVWPEPPG